MQQSRSSGSGADSPSNRPSFSDPNGSAFRNPGLYDIWPKLHLDEKSYLRCRPILKTDAEAARHVGRPSTWIKDKRAIFAQAIELRASWDDRELEGLLNEDLLALAQVEIAGLTQNLGNGKNGKQAEVLKVTNAIKSLIRRTESKVNRNGSKRPRDMEAFEVSLKRTS